MNDGQLVLASVDTLAVIRGELGRSPGTVNHALTALRWWAHRMADRAHEQPGLTPKRRAEMIAQAQRAAQASPVRVESPPRGRHVADGKIRALLQTCVWPTRGR